MAEQGHTSGSRARGGLLLAIAGALCGACEELVEAIPPEELQWTQRGVFSASGRYFVIGERPAQRSDAGSWILEVTRAWSGGVHAVNLVAGALEGSADGALGGPPRGEPCVFTGLAVQGETLYAACTVDNGAKVSLVRVDLREQTVRAGSFTSCNLEPASGAECRHREMYPNGMAIDALGRVYLCDSFAHLTELTSGRAASTLVQVRVDLAASQGATLAFRHRAWFRTDLLSDGILPNGVQIEGDVLYYAAGANLNKLRIREDGSAGEFRVHYTGPLGAYIDDFAIRSAEIVLVQLLPAPAALVRLSATPFEESAQILGTYVTPLDTPPSSVAFAPERAGGAGIFPASSLVLTSFWNGGVQVVPQSVLWP